MTVNSWNMEGNATPSLPHAAMIVKVQKCQNALKIDAINSFSGHWNGGEVFLATFKVCL